MRRLLLGCYLIATFQLHGTPSSSFWTVCTTSVYETGTGHIDEDNYFTVFQRRGHNQAFSPDTGFEIGLFSWKDWSVEAGFDYLGGNDDPLFFNVGIGIGENKLFCHAPSFKIGIFNVGTRTESHNRTNQNIFDIIFGKTLPESFGGGQFYIGGFTGSHAMGNDTAGVMVAFSQPFCKAKYCDDKEYYKWVFVADYASGKNTIGGGGFGIYYYFTPDIDILTGPVWFNDHHINGRWKWSVQIDISFSLFEAKKCS